MFHLFGTIYFDLINFIIKLAFSNVPSKRPSKTIRWWGRPERRKLNGLRVKMLFKPCQMFRVLRTPADFTKFSK